MLWTVEKKLVSNFLFSSFIRSFVADLLDWITLLDTGRMMYARIWSRMNVLSSGESVECWHRLGSFPPLSLLISFLLASFYFLQRCVAIQ